LPWLARGEERSDIALQEARLSVALVGLNAAYSRSLDGNLSIGASFDWDLLSLANSFALDRLGVRVPVGLRIQSPHFTLLLSGAAGAQRFSSRQAGVDCDCFVDLPILYSFQMPLDALLVVPLNDDIYLGVRSTLGIDLLFARRAPGTRLGFLLSPEGGALFGVRVSKPLSFEFSVDAGRFYGVTSRFRYVILGADTAQVAIPPLLKLSAIWAF